MRKKKRPVSREARRDIAYGMYVRNAIRRFELEGKLETIRQMVRAPSCDTDGERALRGRILKFLDQEPDSRA